MVGTNQLTARPVIMVCCSNAQVRIQVEKSIRESHILREFPAFGLGASALPLDQQGPIQPLAGTSETGPIADDQNSANSSLRLDPSYFQEIVNRSSAGTLIGRRLYIAHELGGSSPSRLVTGGVIVRIHALDLLCQLTASHEATESPPASSLLGLDQCHFDGMDDEDEEEDEQADAIATEHGTHTPVGRSILSHEPGSRDVPRNSPAFDGEVGYPSTSTASESLEAQGSQLSLPSERVINNPQRLDPKLDYAIVPLARLGETPSGNQTQQWGGNTIKLGREDSGRTIQIRREADIGLEERKIIAITGSRGVTHGVLMPVPLYFRTAARSQFQALYSVRLQASLARGDSGSAVVDEVTGDLYGHIVRGTPDSGTAYIIPATKVFEDLGHKTQSPIQLAGPANEEGLPATPDSHRVRSPAVSFALAEPSHHEPQVESHHGLRIEPPSPIIEPPSPTIEHRSSIIEHYPPVIEDDSPVVGGGSPVVGGVPGYRDYYDPDFWSNHPIYVRNSQWGSYDHALARNNHPGPFIVAPPGPSISDGPGPFMAAYPAHSRGNYRQRSRSGYSGLSSLPDAYPTSYLDLDSSDNHPDPSLLVPSEPFMVTDSASFISTPTESIISDYPGQSSGNHRRRPGGGYSGLSSSSGAYQGYLNSESPGNYPE